MPSDQDQAVQLLLKEFLYCAYTYLVFITVHILDQIVQILYPKKEKGVHIQSDYCLQAFTPSGTKPLPKRRAAEVTAKCLHDTNHHYCTHRKYKVQLLPLPQLSSTCLVCGVSLENTKINLLSSTKLYQSGQGTSAFFTRMERTLWQVKGILKLFPVEAAGLSPHILRVSKGNFTAGNTSHPSQEHLAGSCQEKILSLPWVLIWEVQGRLSSPLKGASLRKENTHSHL